MSTHTTGPWRFMTDSTGEYLAVYAKPQGGTKVICPIKIADEADARLIAAAPELLDALKECLAVSAAAMRVIAQLDACTLIGDDVSTREQAFLEEVKLEGIPNGFGVRAKAAIAKAERG